VLKVRQYSLCYFQCQQVLISPLISLRSILILSFLLRIFPPSFIFVPVIPGKVYFVLISYLLLVLQVLPISSSIHPTVRLDSLVTGKLFSEFINENCYIFNGKIRRIYFDLLKMGPFLSLERSVTNYPAEW
jgi:hypothetical protein